MQPQVATEGQTLPFPACPTLEKALGYDPESDSEWLSFYYVPGCSMVDDGRFSTSGFDWNYIAFEDLARAKLGLYEARNLYFGSDDGEPNTHRFVLHRPSRTLYVMRNKEAVVLLRDQWEGKPNFLAEQYEKLRAEKGQEAANLMISTALAEVMAQRFDFLGTNPAIRALREEMLAWYDNYFKEAKAAKN